MKRTLAFAAALYWLLIAVPMWWFFVAFGAPLVPRTVGELDLVQAFFLASFYVPLAVLMTLALLALRTRKRSGH
jgi:hypothetical protein